MFAFRDAGVIDRSKTMNSSDGCPPELNVTPLIGVLVVLLTMLILTIPVLTHSVNLELPALNPQPGLKITADRHGQYGRVAQVMAAAQRAGVTRMGLTPTP
jgi:biopolymer transport protein ExbD